MNRDSAVAVVVYAAATVVMTWPLLTGIGRDVPGDLGDSLLNMWILGWGAENVPRLLTGRMSLSDYWNANIFHPEPLTLSLSEHLFGQVIQILPIYWLTGNLILAYNVLFVTSFVLSGLGMYLLVRELLTVDGRARGRTVVPAAAVVAGLIYAFLPFRIAQVAHIQSLSSQWMPFALWGFVRYTRSRDWRWLAAGAGALLMQNWSCGYYLIFFAPFVPIFVVHQLWTAGRLRDWRMWTAFTIAGVCVAGATWPFLALYLEAQRVHGFERPLGEVIRFSADVYSYLTAPEALRVWGGVIDAYPKPEGELFFGFVPWLLAGTALGAVITRGRAAEHAGRRRIVGWMLVAIIVVQSVGFLAILLTGGFITSVAGIPVRATNPTRIAWGIAIAFAFLLAISPGARRGARAALRSPAVFCALLALGAMWLSLGPQPQSRGQTLPQLGLYGVLYDHVPGFEGLRVPARYAMVAGLFLSVVAGFGAAAIIASPVPSRVMATTLAAVWLIEAAFAPLPRNLTWGDNDIVPPAHVEPGSGAPAVYHQLATMPDGTVVAELPFGDPAWDLRYVYYSTVHWKRLVNGYSGAFPSGYRLRVALLQRIAEHPDAAWRALRDIGTTHVVLHEDAMPDANAAFIRRWLDDHFAVEIARFGHDRLYAMPGAFP